MSAIARPVGLTPEPLIFFDLLRAPKDNLLSLLLIGNMLSGNILSVFFGNVLSGNDLSGNILCFWEYFVWTRGDQTA